MIAASPRAAAPHERAVAIDIPTPDPLVELLDDNARPCGSMPKLAAHLAPGHLHRAFSLFAVTASGDLVLQRRAATKYHSPLLLTNTVCGHPFPGEDVADAVRRRAHDELGADLHDLVEVGTVRYHVIDDRTGLHEHEHNHVFVATLDPAAAVPNPDEVHEIVLADASALRAHRAAEPFTAWFDDVHAVASSELARRGLHDEADPARD